MPGPLGGRPSKQELLQKKCREDLRFLTVDVLGKARWSSPFHDDLVRFIDAPGDRKLILMPRGHQKTTIITAIWTIQQLLRDPNKTILIVSAIWGLSRNILREISAFTTTGALPEIFGPFQTASTYWTKDAINIAQRTKHSADPNISTGGIEGGKTGTHCDILIFDDIVSPENSSTKEQIQKTIEAYRDCLPLLNPGGKIIIIGTRYALGDIYGKIMAEEMRSLNGYSFKDEEDRKKWRAVLADSMSIFGRL